jgi:hypothetical protein
VLLFSYYGGGMVSLAVVRMRRDLSKAAPFFAVVNEGWSARESDSTAMVSRGPAGHRTRPTVMHSGPDSPESRPLLFHLPFLSFM